MPAQLVLPFFHSRAARSSSSGRVRALSPVPRMAPAALRAPDLTQEPLPFEFPTETPRIFVHEGVRQSIERKLSTASSGPVTLSITDNRHSMIRHSRRDGVLRVRLHHMFVGAPQPVLDALARYVVRGDRAASNMVGQFINENLHRIRPRRRTPSALVTRGKHHDLLAVFRSVNDTYFEGGCDALITWGRQVARKHRQRTSIKLGSYNAVERLIRIHPALDKPWVPRYFVTFVVFHEMIHHLVPASRGGGRANLHPPAFRVRERGFRHYERSLAWERAHIGRLLRAE